jgi:AcrR family transcriptional regulator
VKAPAPRRGKTGAPRTKAASKATPKAARSTYHHGDTSAALARAALEVLQEAGVEALSLREVSRRVGVNHRAAYRHFPDKRALMAALAADGYRQMAERMAHALAGMAAPRTVGDSRALLALARAYVDWGVKAGPRYTLMTGPRLNEDNRFPALEEAIALSMRLISEELVAASGCTDKTLVRDAALSLWAAVHGVVTLVAVRRVRVKPSLLGAYSDTLLAPLVSGALAALRTSPEQAARGTAAQDGLSAR